MTVGPLTISDIVVELATYVASRPSVVPKRKAPTVCLGMAAQHAIRPARHQQTYETQDYDMPSGMSTVDCESAEEVATTSLYLVEINRALGRVGPSSSLEAMTELGTRTQLNEASHQRLSRQHRRLRPIVTATFAEAA